jgi:hypothetical protein
MPKLFWIGVAVLALGSGPLLVFVAVEEMGLIADPSPNPIGLGLLAFVTFWPGVVMTVVGLAQSLRRRM